MASIPLSVLIPTPRRVSRQRLLLAAVAVTSLLACITALPKVWSLLALLRTLPSWTPLEQVLAQSPLASWLLMLVWGAAVPLCLLATLVGGLHWRGTALTLVALLVAALWYMHMPALQQCSALYGPGNACRWLLGLYPLNLGLAVSVYVFGLLVLLLSAMGWITLPVAEEDSLNRYRYGI